MIFNGKRVNRAGFLTEGLEGRFPMSEHIHNAMNVLLKGADTAKADLRAVVVVAKENSPGDEILGAKDRVMGSQGLDAAGIVFGALRHAGAITVLGDDQGLARKGRVRGIEVLADGFEVSRSPSTDVFVHFDNVHEAGNIPLRSFLERV